MRGAVSSQQLITNLGQLKTKTDTPKRNAEKTAERILWHAQGVFCEKGYEAATTREIADRAGVNVALINRYFGSKLGLFKEAVVPFLSLERFLDGPIETLGQRMADYYVETSPDERFDPIVTLLRSVSSHEAGPVLLDALKRQALDPIAATLKGDATQARATLLTTQAAGLIFKFRILDMPPETDEEREAIRSQLRTYFEALVSGGEGFDHRE